MKKDIHEIRLSVANNIRRLRQENRWTQTRLARLLGLSQNRLSEIERGQGSFTAEQLLLVLKTFNTMLSDFSSASGASAEKLLQNAIARLGAGPLQESRDLLPTEKLETATSVIREVLTSAENPRQITALAPVIVNQMNSTGLNKLRLEFLGEGRINRLGWLLESVHAAILNELRGPKQKWSYGWEDRYHRAGVLIGNILRYPGFSLPRSKKVVEEPLESGVLRSQEAFEEVKASRDSMAKKWAVVTRITTNDFIHVLKEARENN
jgi:transcriptional regulator with XRE-family HTH domain